MFKIAKNKPKHLCVAWGCKNPRTPKNRFCSKHNHRYQKEKNPINHTFNLRRSRAKERGIEWNLTLAEFKQFCEENNYMELKGKSAGSASIDRIDPNKGYEVGNLQILTLAQNSAKMHEDRDDCPF